MNRKRAHGDASTSQLGTNPCQSTEEYIVRHSRRRSGARGPNGRKGTGKDRDNEEDEIRAAHEYGMREELLFQLRARLRTDDKLRTPNVACACR